MMAARPRTLTAPPPVVVQPVSVGGRTVFVARDDLLVGGTKERGLAPVLHALVERGVRTVVYASPFCGFAQIALAAGARAAGCEAVVFCEVAPGTTELHGYSRQAMQLGAHVVPCTSLDDADDQARGYCATTPHSHQLPLGFACPEFMAAYVAALRVAWADACARIGEVPDRVFLPVGSGTLARAFLAVVPAGVELHAIDVNVLDPRDERIEGLARDPRVRLHRAPVPFATPSSEAPAFPSNPFYDAKLLAFVARLAGRASLWWNVAA
jgi:threonine synthase